MGLCASSPDAHADKQPSHKQLAAETHCEKTARQQEIRDVQSSIIKKRKQRLFSQNLLSSFLSLPPSPPPPFIKNLVSLDEVYALQELFETVSNSLVADGLIHKHEWAAALVGPAAAAAVAKGEEERQRREREGAERLASSSAASSSSHSAPTPAPNAGSSPPPLVSSSSSSSSPSSLFVDRVFAAFDAAQNSVLDFPEFVRGLSVFHPRAPAEEKAAFAFRLYDLGKTGAIERRELRELLGAALSDNPRLRLSAEEVDAVVEATFEEADTAGDGVIHPEEWLALARTHPEALRFMTLPGLAAVTSRYPSYVFRKDT